MCGDPSAGRAGAWERLRCFRQQGGRDASGAIDDARGTGPPPQIAPAGHAGRPSPNPAQRSPDGARSIASRRQLAAAGPLPSTLAAHFTTAELAVLKISGDVLKAKGVCGIHIDALAARAGCCRTTVQNAFREARTRSA